MLQFVLGAVLRIFIGTMSATDGENYGLTGVVGAVLRGMVRIVIELYSFTDTVEPLPDLPETHPAPFGAPMPVPTNGDAEHPFDSLAPNGRIWAADYDYGGEGVAYHDTGAINLGEVYRPDEAVDVQSSAEGWARWWDFSNLVSGLNTRLRC